MSFWKNLFGGSASKEPAPVLTNTAISATKSQPPQTAHAPAAPKQPPMPTLQPTQPTPRATCRHKWDESGVECSLCGTRRNLTGMTVVAAGYSLVAPLNTASERDRSFLCISPASYHPDAYDGVWLVDKTKGTTGSFVIEKVLDHQVTSSPKAQELFQQGVNLRGEGRWAMAADFIRRAADLNHAEAQFNYALMCMRRDGVTQSEREGLRWMKKSADSGFEPAKRNCDILRRSGHM